MGWGQTPNSGTTAWQARPWHAPAVHGFQQCPPPVQCAAARPSVALFQALRLGAEGPRQAGPKSLPARCVVECLWSHVVPHWLARRCQPPSCRNQRLGRNGNSLGFARCWISALRHPNWPVYELAHKPVNSTKQTRLRQKLLELGFGAHGLV